MSEAYDEALLINAEVVERALLFQDVEDETILQRILFEVHIYLEPTSKQVAIRVIDKAGLPGDLVDDMVQDAFLRLREAINAWDYTRNPTFLSYWKRVFHNHLITKYKQEWRASEIDETTEDTKQADISSNLSDSLQLQEIRDFYIAKFSTWERWCRRMCTRILIQRILVAPEDAITQKELARQLDRCQSYLSQWERWLRNEIKKDFPNGLAR